MHILLLNEYYPPDTSATAKMAAQVAETLARRHEVTAPAGKIHAKFLQPDSAPGKGLPQKSAIILEAVGWRVLSSEQCDQGLHLIPRNIESRACPIRALATVCPWSFRNSKPLARRSRITFASYMRCGCPFTITSFL